MPARRWSQSLLSREEESAVKRRASLRVAAQAFRKLGYHNTSLDDVAAELQVSKASLYYYFKDKQDLLFQCHTIAYDLAEESLAYATVEAHTSIDALARFFEHYIESLASEIGTVAVLTDLSSLSPINRQIVRKRRDKIDLALRNLVSSGIEDGSIRDLAPNLVINWLMGSVNWMSAWFSPTGKSSGKEVALLFTDILRNGLAQDRSALKSPRKGKRSAPQIKPVVKS
jgi:AcrR family transcriptional regulator